MLRENYAYGTGRRWYAVWVPEMWVGLWVGVGWVMFCSECGAQLVEEPVDPNNAQPDHYYPWCDKCMDYCDAVQTKLLKDKLFDRWG